MSHILCINPNSTGNFLMGVICTCFNIFGYPGRKTQKNQSKFKHPIIVGVNITVKIRYNTESIIVSK